MLKYASDLVGEYLGSDFAVDVAVEFSCKKVDAGPLYDSPKGPLGSTCSIKSDVSGVWTKGLDGKIIDITSWYRAQPDFKNEVNEVVNKHCERALL